MRSLLCFVLTVSVLSSAVLAQETRSPREFFDDSFVTKEETRIQNEDDQESEREAPEWEKSAEPQAKSPNFREPDGFFETEKKETAENDIAALPKEDYLPVHRINLVVDGTDMDHLFESLRYYESTLRQFDLPAGAVKAAGLTAIPSRDVPFEWMRIIARGGSLGTDWGAVEEHGIERSPSWILETSEGKVILDGYVSIDRFLSPKGEFRKRFLAEAEQPAAVKEEAEPVEAGLSAEEKKAQQEMILQRIKQAQEKADERK